MLNSPSSEVASTRQYAPATQRNRSFILEVLQQVLPPTGTVLEVASGTGEHAVYFAPNLQPRLWVPSDPNPVARASIMAWRSHLPCENLAAPIALDAAESQWSIEQAPEQEQLGINLSALNAIVNINMIHISPWFTCLGLMAGAGRLLPQGGILYLYGPFKQQGKHTAFSNEDFDASLQAQNPDWGVRNLEDVDAVAQSSGFQLQQILPMPANNLSVIWEKI